MTANASTAHTFNSSARFVSVGAAGGGTAGLAAAGGAFGGTGGAAVTGGGNIGDAPGAEAEGVKGFVVNGELRLLALNILRSVGVPSGVAALAPLSVRVCAGAGAGVAGAAPAVGFSSALSLEELSLAPSSSAPFMVPVTPEGRGGTAGGCVGRDWAVGAGGGGTARVNALVGALSLSNTLKSGRSVLLVLSALMPGTALGTSGGGMGRVRVLEAVSNVENAAAVLLEVELLVAGGGGVGGGTALAFGLLRLVRGAELLGLDPMENFTAGSDPSLGVAEPYCAAELDEGIGTVVGAAWVDVSGA